MGLEFILYTNKMAGDIEKRAAVASCIPHGMERSYGANVKLMLINHAEKMNNCNAAVKLRVLEANT
jgi:hypothetical protein